MGATVWSLWSRNKWWVLLPSPLFLPSSFCVTFWKTKIHQSLISLLNMTPATWDRHRLYSSLCSFSSGGWSELSAAGDLWDWEQIQQPRIKGKHQTARECFSLRASVTASDVTWQFGKKWITDLKLFLLLSPGCRRWDQRQQRWVCGVFVGCAGHTHPAVQTPVSLQRLRRHSALPGQLLPHLQTAWVHISDEHCKVSPSLISGQKKEKIKST